MERTLLMPMFETARIADQLRRAFYSGAWHGEALFEILRGVTAKQAAARPIKSAHSIWELVLHIAAWDGAVRKRMMGVPVKLSAARNFPAVTDTSEAAWTEALEHLRSVHDELIEAVEKFPKARLSAQVPGKKGAHYNFQYMLDGLAQHELYHAGQIALLKKM
jgi:uncharacterized damage-inducible protein DinB